MANPLAVNDPNFPQVGNIPGGGYYNSFQSLVDATVAAGAGIAPVDPFIGDPVQTQRLRAYVNINLFGDTGNADITSRIQPFLLSVRVHDGRGSDHEYTAELEVDDRDARLPIPPLGAFISIDMGWINESAFNVFRGTVAEVEHGFARKQGGRRMWIHCTGTNDLGPGKDPKQGSWGDGAEPGQSEGAPVNIMTPMQEAAKNANYSFAIAPKFAGITRDHWSQDNESFHHFGARIADEIGGFFRVTGGTDAMINAYDEMADGQPPAILCKWGYNLISWKVKPMIARPAWAGSNQQFFDHLQGQWKTIANQVGMPGPWGFASSVFALPKPAANQSNADSDSGGAAEQIAGHQAPGRIVINGEPRAHAGGQAILIGARPGVDGTYNIHIAEHLYSREGYVTWLDVEINTTSTGQYAFDGHVYQFAGGFGGGSTITTPPVTPSLITQLPPLALPPGGQTGITGLPLEQPAGPTGIQTGASRQTVLGIQAGAISNFPGGTP